MTEAIQTTALSLKDDEEKIINVSKNDIEFCQSQEGAICR